MRNEHGNNHMALQHYWAHARMVKAVRRACKGGIALVASLQAYRDNGAKVHFLLDRMGDLGRIARKDFLDTPENDTYVPITTSELCFCFRHWDSVCYRRGGETKLKDIVNFYCNGARVFAPWKGEWRRHDCFGVPVFSNPEAWARYGLYRKLVGSDTHGFPGNDRGTY
jgi:hypothetical protein